MRIPDPSAYSVTADSDEDPLAHALKHKTGQKL